MAKMKKQAREAMLEADAAVAKAVRPHELHPAVRALGLVSDLADQPPMRILCGSVIAVGLVGGDRRLTRAGLRMLAAHSLATWTKDYIKRRVDRTRPRAMSKPGKDHRPSSGRDTSKEETSFPSGHSAGAAAVASAFAAEYPEHRLPALAAGGGVALAQIPRCAHYPSDVGAGVAIGLAADLLVGAALRLWDLRRAEEE
jgi:membrane-associated phospholipid phosphatase